MTIEKEGQHIDLSKVTRLYPAALMRVDGEEVHMSLEWAEQKKDKVSFEGYALVFDFDKPGEAVKNRQTLYFKTKDELFEMMKEVSALLAAK